MKLSIIIPAYNEKNTIREILDIVKKVNIGNVEREIIFIDDGSTDGTRDILKNTPGIRYILHEKNLGKGGAVKKCFNESTGDQFIVKDADLEYDPEDYKAKIVPIISGKTEMVLGVRISL